MKGKTVNIRRNLTKSRAGHWTLTLTNLDTGYKVYSDRHNSRHNALAEEDALMALLQKRAAPTDDQFLAALGPCGR